MTTLNKKRVMPWKPDLLKEVKHYSVSYHPPKGDRIKIKISSPHKIGSPEFTQQAHREAGKQGHKGGMIGSCQEITVKSMLVKFSGLAALMMTNKKRKAMEKKKKVKPRRFIQPDPSGPLKRLGDLTERSKLEGAKGSYKRFVEATERRQKGEVEKMDQQLVGGHADRDKPQDFDQEQLKMGIKIEMEHTSDPEKAKEIAMDHLKEIPDYYTRLRAMEERADKDDVEKKDPEDLWEKRPSTKPKLKPRMAEWAAKYPDEFGTARKQHKIGQQVGFKDDEGVSRKGEVVDVRSEKLHVKDTEGMVHRVPFQDIEEPIKKVDVAQLELLEKSIEDDWILRLGDEFKVMAKTAGVSFEAIQMPQGAIRQHIFKIGNCAVVHKTLGRLVDIKCHSTMNSPQEHQKLAKALYYKLQIYYHKNPASSVEKHVGMDSIGIFKADLEKGRALYGQQYSKPWMEGLAGQIERRRKVTLGRKRRPQLGTRKPKSLQQWREGRIGARLMGAQEERKNIGKSLTPFGKDFAKKVIQKIREKKAQKSAISPSTPSPEKPSIDTPKSSGTK